MYQYDSCRVIRVLDGDTIEVMFDLGFEIYHRDIVRLTGINTPETHGVTKEAGLKSKARVVDLLINNPANELVSIVTTKKGAQDSFGRYLGAVKLNDGSILNDILLQEGLAVPFMV